MNGPSGVEPVVGDDPPPQIPEDVYGSWCPSLSPDGEQVAFISDRGGLPEVWIRSMDGGRPVRVPFAGQRVTGVSWSPTGEWLAGVVAPVGASRTEIWVARPDGSEAHLVAGAAPGTAVLAEGRSRGWTAAGELIVTEFHPGSRVLRIDPSGGADAFVLSDGELMLAVDVTPDGRRLLLRKGPRGARDVYVRDLGRPSGLEPLLPRLEGGSTDAGCLSPDGELAHLRSDADRELAELVTVPLGSDAPPIVLGRAESELEDIVLSADGRVAALTWNVEGGLSALTLLEVATGRQHAVVPLPRPVVHGCGLSHDGSRLVLCAEGPADPRGIWTLDVAAALAAEPGPGGPVGLVPVSSPGRGPLKASVGATADSIEPAAVVRPVLVGFRSADGTPISGWLYSPGIVGPFPTLIWLHGGPEMQERPVYNSLFQSLLAAGIAVFAPNVRGSTGHGRAFRHADDVAGRYGAFEDVEACVGHLVDIGIAEPGRIGISGRSYGGYLAVAALVRFPELFAVGVDVCGMTDLHTFYADTEPWIAAAAVSKYGHPEHDRDLLRDLSPLRAVDRIRAPLLIVHGADDTNVPLGEATQLAAALAERGMPHRLLVFEGEGHELLATENRVEFVRAVVAWVCDHMGDPRPTELAVRLTG
jgi:dipeptidyl aminopeptidase/acylaminoacyl peptidase